MHIDISGSSSLTHPFHTRAERQMLSASLHVAKVVARVGKIRQHPQFWRVQLTEDVLHHKNALLWPDGSHLVATPWRWQADIRMRNPLQDTFDEMIADIFQVSREYDTWAGTISWLAQEVVQRGKNIQSIRWHLIAAQRPVIWPKGTAERHQHKQTTEIHPCFSTTK